MRERTQFLIGGIVLFLIAWLTWPAPPPAPPVALRPLVLRRPLTSASPVRQPVVAAARVLPTEPGLPPPAPVPSPKPTPRPTRAPSPSPLPSPTLEALLAQLEILFGQIDHRLRVAGDLQPFPPSWHQAQLLHFEKVFGVCRLIKAGVAVEKLPRPAPHGRHGRHGLAARYALLELRIEIAANGLKDGRHLDDVESAPLSAAAVGRRLETVVGAIDAAFERGTVPPHAELISELAGGLHAVAGLLLHRISDPAASRAFRDLPDRMAMTSERSSLPVSRAAWRVIRDFWLAAARARSIIRRGEILGDLADLKKQLPPEQHPGLLMLERLGNANFIPD